MIIIETLQTEKNILKELVENGIIDEEIMVLAIAKLEMIERKEEINKIA